MTGLTYFMNIWAIYYNKNISGLNIKLKPYEDAVLEKYYEPFYYKV